MQKKLNLWTRQLAALACLFAVLLLQAPFARAAWIAVTADCCLSDHCPIPSHHHKTQPANEEMPMDCGHEMKHHAECKLSCCESTDQNAINVVLFVMPVAQSNVTLQNAAPRVSQYVPQMISRSEKPQSPPPKSFLS